LWYTRLGAGLEGRDTLSRWGGSGGRGGRRVETRRGCDGNRVCVASIMFCPCQNLQEEKRDLVCNTAQEWQKKWSTTKFLLHLLQNA